MTGFCAYAPYIIVRCLTHHKARRKVRGMAPRSLFPELDRQLGGTLADKLRQLRDDGLTFNEIAYTLRDRNGINVSGETIRRWLRNNTAEVA